MSLYETGVMPHIDAYLKKKSEEERDYGDLWSASSAGYCYRKIIFERLRVPKVENASDARKTRVFEVGHVFHRWYQDITKNAGISIAQELELIDTELMIKGHIDDLVLIDGHLILYDAKTQNSKAFTWQKGRPMSYYHKMQLGTYMYMLRQHKKTDLKKAIGTAVGHPLPKTTPYKNLSEARTLKISKDDLRMSEQQLLWSDELEQEITDWWKKLNTYWKNKEVPPCTCASLEGGFMAKEAYNPYFYRDSPCSIEHFNKFPELTGGWKEV